MSRHLIHSFCLCFIALVLRSITLGRIVQSQQVAVTWTTSSLDPLNSLAEQIVQLDLDSPAFLYEKVELECRYRLNAKEVYSIKWYKDGQEFLEYLPHEKPQARFFSAKGVRIGTPAYSITNDTFRLWLQSVTLESQGVYRCEISTDAPEFITFKDHKELEVYVLPSKSPRITGKVANLQPKSRVDLNCTSPRSKPVSSLQWFINDKLPPSDYLIEYRQVNHSDGLQSKTLRLKFIVNEEHFKFGNMKLKCVAVYKKLSLYSNNATLIGRHSKLSPKLMSPNKPNNKSATQPMQPDSNASSRQSLVPMLAPMSATVTCIVLTLFAQSS